MGAKSEDEEVQSVEAQTLAKAVGTVADKAHQAKNLLENYLVSGKEKQILSNVIPQNQNIGQMKV